MLLSAMFEIRYYVTEDGRQPFAKWFADVESLARAKITRAITRMAEGTSPTLDPSAKGFSNTKLISGLATAFISGEMATLWSFC